MVEIIVPHDIRYYKGKYRVQVILKSKGNYRVRALEDILESSGKPAVFPHYGLNSFDEGEEFTTVPRLLWRHPRK